MGAETQMSWRHEMTTHENNIHLVEDLLKKKHYDVETYPIDGILQEKNFSAKIMQKM